MDLRSASVVRGLLTAIGAAVLGAAGLESRPVELALIVLGSIVTGLSALAATKKMAEIPLIGMSVRWYRSDCAP